MLHLVIMLLRASVDVLTFLFLVGAIGCAVVLVMTFWEDLKTLAGH